MKVKIILGVLTILFLVNMLDIKVASGPVPVTVIDTTWEKSNCSIDRSPCQSAAPTDTSWTWTNVYSEVWDGINKNLADQFISGYIPGYWAFIDYPVSWTDYIPGYDIPNYVKGSSYPRPQVHQWFKTALNFPSMKGMTKIELIGFYKQQSGGIITVNDNMFIFVNPSTFALKDIVAYGGTADQDWIGFTDALVSRLAPSPVHCDFSDNGGCQGTNYDPNTNTMGGKAPETTWYIDPLNLPVATFHPGSNVIYVLLEEFCGGGGLGHLAFRITGSVAVDIDIKPGSYPNSINLKSKGVVPVAILSNRNFDASTVNPKTVLFAGAKPVRWTMEDVDGDGDRDMLFHFNTQDLKLDANRVKATLTGKTTMGLPIEGTDTVKIVSK